MRTFRSVLLILTLVGALLPALPASAQTAENVACLGIPDAGFADVAATSIFKHDIDCIAFYGITSGTAAFTYSPAELVPRWQMAVFLVRTYPGGQLPDGSGGIFGDIASLSDDAQTSINQLKRMGITAGVAPGVFDPYAAVPRWQMAIFLTRLVLQSGVALPDGAPQGFTDIGALPPEAQTAINQARQLGIAAGTSATTFDPLSSVTREQMASFLARAFNVVFVLPLSNPDVLVCNIPFEQSGSICTGMTNFPAGRTFTIREGWNFRDPLLQPGINAVFTTSFQLYLDGAPISVVQTAIIMEGFAVQHFAATFPSGLTGTHVLEGRWIDSLGVVDGTVTMTVNFLA